MAFGRRREEQRSASKTRQYWGPHIKRKTPTRNIKRVPGKTKRFIKGAGRQVWVGKDVTSSGWIKKTTFDSMLEHSKKIQREGEKK